MKEITMFHFEGCPYCKKAEKYIADLFRENPEFSALTINRIDERKNPESADQFDYYYVPTFYYGNEKLHEGDISKKELQQIFSSVLNR